MSTTPFFFLRCDWGTRVGLADDREVCPEQAIQRVMLHGHVEGDLLVQLCRGHYDRVSELTDPHAEVAA